MALIGFTVLKEKILDGSKRQTIRKARKHQIKVNDKLYLYWHLRQKDCEKLGEATCTWTLRAIWNWLRDVFAMNQQPTEEFHPIWELDGFTSGYEAIKWFEKTHHPNPEDLFDIIRWQKLVVKEDLL